MTPSKPELPVVRVSSEAVRMARALVSSQRRRGADVDPWVEKIANAEPPVPGTAAPAS